MTRFQLAAIGAVLALAGAPATLAQAHPDGASTANIQGNDQQSWINDAHMHQFYELSVASLRPTPAAEQLTAYEQKSYAIFRAFGASRGMDPDKMQDHLKLIPRQMIQVAREDPSVLKDYDTFLDALFGPK